MGNFISSKFMNDIFSGITTGIVVALVALSLVIIWRSTHILNFAQGAMAMFAAYIGMTQIDRNIPFFWCLLISVAIGFVMGGVTERVLIRPLYGKPEINPIVVMVGLLGLLEAVATAIWTSTVRTIPTPFSEFDFSYHGRTILLNDNLIFQVILAVAVLTAIALLFRFTKLGLQLRAAALAPEVAKLLGVRVNRMLTFGWMLASLVGALSAAIYTSGSQSGLAPTAMDGLFVSGFIAAAIGGLESPVGAVVGGLSLGIVNQFIRDYWSANASQLTPLAILIVVLMVRPQGLFTRVAARRV